jgi:hypothetical protein
MSMNLWAPRKIGPTRRTPQNCLRKIPVRSRSDSLTFTPTLSAIGSESDFSRFPYVFCLVMIVAGTPDIQHRRRRPDARSRDQRSARSR